jgi:hypothetical protein
MLIIAIQTVVWAVLITVALGALLLIGFAIVLCVLFVGELRGLWRSLERRRDTWAHIADPWDGFAEKTFGGPSQPTFHVSNTPVSAAHRDITQLRNRIGRGESSGGINIEM